MHVTAQPLRRLAISRTAWDATLSFFEKQIATLFVGNKWGVMHEYGLPSSCSNGTGICLLQTGQGGGRWQCPAAFNHSSSVGTLAEEPLRADFDLIVFNIGLHAIAPWNPNPPSFDQFREGVASCAQPLRARFPNQRAHGV